MGPEPISADAAEQGRVTVALPTTAVVMGSGLGLRPPRNDSVVSQCTDMV